VRECELPIILVVVVVVDVDVDVVVSYGLLLIPKLARASKLYGSLVNYLSFPR